MRRGIRTFIAIVGAPLLVTLLSAFASLTGCGIEVVGQATSDAGRRNDTGTTPGAPPPGVTPPGDRPDGGPLDAASDAQVSGCLVGQYFCPATGFCVTSCATGCTGTPFDCLPTRTCVAGCPACAGATFECVKCEGAGSTLTPTRMTCYEAPEACASAKGARCEGCQGSGLCPGLNQWCKMEGSTKFCEGCGAPGSQGVTCELGGNCDEASRTCL